MVLFIGADVGDAETIMAFSKGDDRNVLMATMPGKNAAGQAIPTLYGYTESGSLQLADSVASCGSGLKNVAMNFKRCPSDIINADMLRKQELMAMDDEELWKQPEMRDEKILEYSDKLNTFIEVILTHPDFVKIIEPQIDGCDECRVCVGHPTRWQNFDVRIYQAILRHGILGEETYQGKKLTLTLERESRAAFLYIKDAYKINIQKNEYIGLCDIGSSTIDISVLSGGDSRNCVYNDGQNFLGARSIDYLIMEYYMEQVKNSNEREEFADIFAVGKNGRKRNPAAWEHMLLNCRFAKEALFSSSETDKSRVSKRINVLEFNSVKLTYDCLINDICNRPIADVLKKYCDLTDEQYKALGKRSWKEAFRDFMLGQKEKMRKEGIVLSQLFFTGSASRMVFIKEICAEVFSEIKETRGLLDDTNPSNAIANGLSRVGVSDEKAAVFVAEIEEFLTAKTGLYHLVENRIPDLISDIAEPTVKVICDKIVVSNFKKWQEKEYETVNSMMAAIEASLKDEEQFGKALGEDEEFNNAISIWIRGKLGNDIATELLKIATKYKVYDFSLEELKIFNVEIEGVYTGNTGIDVSGAIHLDSITTAISVVVGYVSYLIAPYIIGIVIGLMAIISQSIYISLLTALLSCPEPVFTTILAAVGLVGGQLTKKMIAKKQNVIAKKLNRVDLPKFVRKKVKVEDVEKAFNEDKDEIITKMKAKFKKEEKIQEIVEKISKEIKPQVKNRADQIKYVIESR